MTDDSGEEPRESFDVRFWGIRSYKGKRGATYTVRWTVAGQVHPETFATRPLAESRLAELRTHARNGVPFDVETGLPVPEVRKAQAEVAKAGELSWYQHALNYVARRRKGLAPNSVRSIAETLTTVTTVLLVPGRGQPGGQQVRDALYLWAFRRQDAPPEQVTEVLRWISEHSRPLADLADQDVMLDVLDAISVSWTASPPRRTRSPASGPCSATFSTTPWAGA